MSSSGSSFHFNSIKVRLKPDENIEDTILDTDFNSIKVRLKLPYFRNDTRKYVISIP